MHGDWKDLVKASREGNLPLIRLHLSHKVDPNFQHPEYFTSPLVVAIQAGQVEAVKALLEGGADADLEEQASDDRPVEIALQKGEFEIVEILQEALSPEKRLTFRHVVVVGVREEDMEFNFCRQLLQQGHSVTVAGSSPSVTDALIRVTQNRKVQVLQGSIESISSTLKLAASIKELSEPVDSIVVNAGSHWSLTSSLNQDGLDVSFHYNYLVPSLLQRELQNLRLVLLTDKPASKAPNSFDKLSVGNTGWLNSGYGFTQYCTVSVAESAVVVQMEGLVSKDCFKGCSRVLFPLFFQKPPKSLPTWAATDLNTATGYVYDADGNPKQAVTKDQDLMSWTGDLRSRL